MPTTLLELENKLLEKIEAISRNIGELAIAVAGMREKVEGISLNLHESRQHGERIKALETDVSNIKGDLKSAATERRWMVGVVATAVGVLLLAAIAFAALMVQAWGMKPHL